MIESTETKQFRNTRLVANYEDSSELHFLIDDDSYVWCRPNKKQTRFEEIAILAASDALAVEEVRQLSHREFTDQMFNGLPA